jgi:hypothetical protein
MEASSISEKVRDWTTFLRDRALISSFSSFRSTSRARFRWGSWRTSSRNCSEKMENSGVSMPAVSKMSITWSEATERETIWRTAASSSARLLPPSTVCL